MIEIKNGKRPTKPGTYLVLRGGDHQRVEVAHIYERHGELEFLSGISIFPLSKLERDAKFSEEIQWQPS